MTIVQSDIYKEYIQYTDKTHHPWIGAMSVPKSNQINKMSRNSERLNGSGGAPPGSGSSAKDANNSGVDIGDELSMNRIIDFLKDQ